MFTNPLVINDGGTDINYDFRGHPQVETSSYKNASAPLDKPQTFTVKHTVASKGKPTQARRSLYDFSEVVENEQGVQGVLRCYLVIQVPEKIAEAADVVRILATMQDFITDSPGRFEKIVAGEL